MATYGNAGEKTEIDSHICYSSEKSVFEVFIISIDIKVK
jgi:hypothetical protein